MNTGEAGRTDQLLQDLEALGDAVCADCAGPLGGHAYVVSVALGFKDKPRCARCVADALGRDLAGLLPDLASYIRARPCYRAGWEWASRRDGHLPEDKPGEIWLSEQPKEQQ